MLRKSLLVIFSALSISGISPLYSQFSGNALDFDGVDDMVVVNKVPELFSNPGTNDFTFEAWVNPHGSEFQRIFFAQPSTSDFVSVTTGYDNIINLYVIMNDQAISCGTHASIPQDEWTHIAARWTASTRTPEVFFNGILQESSSAGISTTGTSGLMTLGSRTDGAQYFHGAIDEARLWSEARTASEIASNMDRSIKGSPAGLVFNWNFNEGIGRGNNVTVTTLPDVSGHSYTGTLTNFKLMDAASNWIGSRATVIAAGNPVVGPNHVQHLLVCSGASVTFPDGTMQTNIISTMTHLCSLPVSSGDSMITTIVNVQPVYTMRDTVAVASGSHYIFPDGVVSTEITSTISHTSLLKTKLGCDSTINTTVTIIVVNRK